MAALLKPQPSGEGGPMMSLVAYGGQDLGNHWSKLALSFLADSSGQSPLWVSRVGFQGSTHHPENHRGQGRSRYEFVATAALRDGELIWGQQALSCDHSFSLKAVLLLYSGITREETFLLMPDGLVLLRLFKKGEVTLDMMENVLLDHFRFLREQMMKHLNHINNTTPGWAKGVTDVERICVTHPNFICPLERTEDFHLLKKGYLALMRRVWGDRIYLASEGQTIGAYATDPYYDVDKCYRRRDLIEKLFPGCEAGSKRVMVFDAGSSSVNIQTQVIF